MFPGAAGGGVDATNAAASTSASVAAKPPAEMSASEYVAAANAPREGRVAAGVVGNAGTGFQWEDVLKAGREGKLDVNTNGDEVGTAAAPAAAPGGGGGEDAAAGSSASAAPLPVPAPAAASASAAPVPVPAAVAVPAKRTPPSQLPAASPAADAAGRSAAAWAEVMAAGRAGTLDMDTTGARGKGAGVADAPAAAP